MKTLLIVSVFSLCAPACRRTPVEFRAVTFNAGLAPGMTAFSKERAPAFAKELAGFRDDDVACFQEVWNEEDAVLVERALRLPAEQSYRVDTRGQNERLGDCRCDPNDVVGIQACVSKRCADQPKEEVGICAMRRCAQTLAVLRDLAEPGCFQCLVAESGRPAADVFRTCTAGQGTCRAYGGTNGVILASKWPLEDRAFVSLPSSTTVNRVALFAALRLPGHDPIEVACTHLSSPQAVPPANCDFSTWEAEQSEQVRVIAARLRQRARGRQVLLLGDLNTGLSLRNGTWQAEPAWDRVVHEGFKAPILDMNPFCTLCPDNRLRDADSSRIIDHILLFRPPSGVLKLLAAWPVMTERHALVTAKSGTIELETSDHYGVEARFLLR